MDQPKTALPEAQTYATALADALKTMAPGTAEFIRTTKELAVMRRDHRCK
ncbi:MAG: hypothetical protein AB7V45_09650 [Candidatus Krumholzibacteriia bacterium]